MKRHLGLALLVLLPAGAAAATEDPFGECRAAFAADPRAWQAVNCYFAVGRQTGRWQETRDRLQALLAEHGDNGWLRLYLGRIALERSEEGAEPWLRDAIDDFTAWGEPLGEAYARINLARFLRGRRNLAEAQEELDRAAVAAEAAGDTNLQVDVQVQRARLLQSRGGDLIEVYRLLRQAEELAFPDGNASLRRDVLFALGGISFELGRYSRAQSYYDRLLALNREQEDRLFEAVTRLSIARNATAVAEGPADRERIAGLFADALATALDSGNRYVEAEARLSLGRLLPGDDGVEQLEGARAIAVDLNLPALEQQAIGFLGARTVERDPAEAVRLKDSARTRAVALEDPWPLAYGWSPLATIDWQTLPREEAAARTLDTIGLLERLRELQAAEGGRAELFAVWTEPYYWLSGQLLTEAEGGAPQAVEEAFEVTERMRARVLLDAIGATEEATEEDAQTQVGDELRSTRQKTLRSLVDVNRQLLDPRLTPAERQGWMADLETLELELEGIDHQIAAARDQPVESVEFAAAAEVAAGLGDDEALFSFQLAPWQDVHGDFTGGAWLTVVTGAGSRVYRLPGRPEVERKVSMLLGLFERRDGSFEAPAASLYRDLLAAAVADLPPDVEHLVLVPDGVLHLLPFGALVDPAGGALADRFRLTATPSATLWLRWRRAGVPPTELPALAMVDPSIGATAESTSVERGWALARGERLGRLPYARREGRALARRLGGSEVLAGRQATERYLKEGDLGRFRILHLAAHAVVDDENPQRSAVLLAAGDEAEDGLLQPREIVELDLAGRVVVLSACQSATGSVLRGEGVMSLARAFFQAGAHAVVGSLWPLRDDEAATFFDIFYDRLGRGLSLAEALAEAQREMRRAAAPAAAWAGLVVLGDGDLVPLPGGRPAAGGVGPVGVAVAGALLLVAGGAAVLFVRRRRTATGRRRG